MHQFGQRCLPIAVSLPEHGRQKLCAETGTDDRRGVEYLLGRGRQSIDACTDGCLQGRWHADVVNLPVPLVGARFTDDDAPFGVFAPYFLDIERISSRSFDDALHELAERWI